MATPDEIAGKIVNEADFEMIRSGRGIGVRTQARKDLRNAIRSAIENADRRVAEAERGMRERAKACAEAWETPIALAMAATRMSPDQIHAVRAAAKGIAFGIANLPLSSPEPGEPKEAQ